MPKGHHRHQWPEPIIHVTCEIMSIHVRLYTGVHAVHLTCIYGMENHLTSSGGGSCTWEVVPC